MIKRFPHELVIRLLEEAHANWKHDFGGVLFVCHAETSHYPIVQAWIGPTGDTGIAWYGHAEMQAGALADMRDSACLGGCRIELGKAYDDQFGNAVRVIVAGDIPIIISFCSGQLEEDLQFCQHLASLVSKAVA